MFDLLAAAGLLLAAALMICLVRRSITARVHKSENIELRTIIEVSGDAPEMEQTVKELRWLISSGTLESELVICDCGMDGDSRKMAELLARDGSVRLVSRRPNRMEE